MVKIDIPGRGSLNLEHFVSDVNGTLAVDGILLPGIIEAITALRSKLIIHLLTADTHGRQVNIDRQLNTTATRIQPGNEAQQKAEYVRQLGADKVVALGQGANDVAMLKEAALGLCVLSPEGMAVEAFLASDLIVPDVLTAFALLQNPLRVTASLRK
jgi:P-type E1-E2 ATPase